MTDQYKEFSEHLRKIGVLGSIGALLGWDNEVYKPEKAAGIRAEQNALLSGMMHEEFTSPDFEKIVEGLSADKSLSKEQAINVKKVHEDLLKQKKFSKEFIQKQSMIISEAFGKWHAAKTQNNFSLFEESLEKVVALCKESAEILGYEEHPYDALLDMYEPGMTTKKLKVIFANVKEQLVPYYNSLLAKKQVDNSILHHKFEKQKQWDISIELLKQMGYDFAAGRQDYAPHPFSVSMHPTDARITTRVDENNLCELIWSSLHEGGHALYEQGLDVRYFGQPQCSAASLGIHESQSRLWENNVGRSLVYWKANYHLLQKTFPETFAKVDVMDFYKAINKVQPGFIRTNADEISYHLHVLIRFEIEVALMEDKIKVKDLPDFWNAKYKEYLGVDVPTNTLGVLQDVHWSHGSLGYFPTYSIGSFYAAQLFAHAEKNIPQLKAKIENGETGELLSWLRTNIHIKGKLYTSEEICEQTTGEGLNFDYFMKYVKAKYDVIYA
ncbi:MAG: carboxypeptidase M32 [Bacteroidetes bacterium]|nr:carboxypeptidase M32 [Bacteroidota bacterium]